MSGDGGARSPAAPRTTEQRSTATRLAIWYAAFASAAVLFEDWFLSVLPGDMFGLGVQHSVVEVGLAAATTAVLFLLVRREERATAEHRRREGESEDGRMRALALLQDVVDGSSEGIYVKDVQGRYLLLNREAVRTIGKPVEDLLGRDDVLAFPPEEAARLMADDREVLRLGQAITCEERHGSGEGGVVISSTKWPLRDHEGRITGLAGVSRDVTAARRAEEILRESAAALSASEERFRLMFEHNLDAVLLAVPDVGILAANPAAERIFGYTLEKPGGIPKGALMPEEDPKRAAILEELARSGLFRGEADLRHRDGHLIPCDLSVARFQDSGGQDLVAVIARDLSGARAAEALLELQYRRSQCLLGLPQAVEQLDEAGLTEYGRRVAEHLTDSAASCVLLSVESGSAYQCACAGQGRPGVLPALGGD